MPLFVGSHINRVDRKGRVSVPAPFRNTLGDPLPQGLYVMRSIRGVQALDAFSPDAFAKLAASIDNPFATADDDFTTAIFGASMLLTFDGEGRIMLPDMFRTFAGIEGEACFIGRGPFFQIWEPEAGLTAQEAAFRRAVDNRAEIGLRFAGPDGGQG